MVTMKKKEINFYKPLAFVLLILILLELQFKFNIFSDLNGIKRMFGSPESDKVMVLVNSEKIYQSEFNATYNSLKIGNPAVAKSDVLQLLIEQKVLVSKAKSLGITVNDSEVKQYLDQYIQQVGGEQQFDFTLKSLNLSKEMFENMLREQIYIQKLFEQYYFNQIDIDDNEVNDFVEQQFGSADAVNDSVKQTLKEALLAQKRIIFIQEKVDELVKEADIRFLADFEDYSGMIPSDVDDSIAINDNSIKDDSTLKTVQIDVPEDNLSMQGNRQLNSDLKECVKKQSEDVDFFIICDDCDMFKSFFADKDRKAYIGTPDDETISLIKNCLSSVYQGYIPEVICLNNGKSLTDDFDSKLESFFEDCV